MNTEILTSNYVSIRLPLPMGEGFTYAVPENMNVTLGSYVQVPFGNKVVLGVVWEIDVTTSVAPKKIKPITEIYIDIPPMTASLRRFIAWVADYTLAPVGNVLKMALSVPKALEKNSPEIVTYYSVNEAVSAKVTKQRQKVLDYLSQVKKATLKEIAEETAVSAAVIRAMQTVGLIISEEMEVLDSNIGLPPLPDAIPLSDEQQQAADYLVDKLQETRYSATLLDGVTGSGKTEVYFAAIRHILETSEGQILILLPEIVLTNQLLARFEQRFGFQPVAWHSGLTPKQRQTAWKSTVKGDARLIIGARSALFLPFPSLSLIIVDEEHDSSYKQEEGVAYNARDMAVVRASLEKIPIVLASATPSLETVHNVDIGKFHAITLPARFGGAVMPSIDVVDMRQQGLSYGLWLSEPLKRALADTLHAGKQSMLYLNRRGYAPLTLCRKCGYRLQCPHCSSWLVEHRKRCILQCHHCGYNKPPPSACPECKEVGSMVACGPGVERIAEEVASLLPQAKLAVLASDVIASPAEARAIVESIIAGEIDIIVGTQMIAKGHHFPNLTLVGVIDADLGLEGGDLRAVERTYQLLHQVSGRAGREKDKGRVIMQSYHPDNTILHALQKEGRDAFLAQEMRSRERNAMPPFTRLAGIILSGKEEGAVLAAAKKLVKYAPQEEGLRILGPAPAPMAYLRGNYRYRLLIKAKRTILLQKALKFWLMSVKTPSSVRIKVDIDPYNFF